MKLSEILKQITIISDDEEKNTINYLRATNFIENLYKFNSKMKSIVESKDLEYLPTFKDCYLSEQLGIPTITEENELRLIKIKSSLFLVDKIVENITENFLPICTNIIHDKNIITFYLK